MEFLLTAAGGAMQIEAEPTYAMRATGRDHFRTIRMEFLLTTAGVAMQIEAEPTDAM